MNIGIIGLGARGLGYVEKLKAPEYSAHKITAVCEIDQTRLHNFCSHCFHDSATAPKMFTDYRDMFDAGLVDAVIICTPDYAHREIALAAMDAHVHILLEKPIEVTLSRVSDIFERGKNYDRTLIMCFELRFAPLYSRIHSIVESGRLGKIVTVQACERLSSWHASSFMRRWHRYEKNSGGFMNTKCCHDMDILRYIIGSEVETVVAFGDRRVFVPKEDAPKICKDCKYENECIYKFDYTNYDTPTYFSCIKNLCPYNSGSELIDNEMMLLKYKNGVMASFELCLFSGAPTRQMVISGTKAELRADLSKNLIWVTPLGGETEEISPSESSDGHGGGDERLLADFIGNIEKGFFRNNVYDGYIATRTALAGEISMKERRIVSMCELDQ